ncbi:MAG: tRNA (N6-isopentenyl adenosine(37)-C2)-methylthiotransferase MiaB [Endomicrobia bacterium]|nr:tRNA (N6-isopentenyl adenosine(37)-C2)-methylthiotransferase MiaB [Endomicrobiia bacterium]MCL2506895.1 tRNA (N6-isopentenyl adenosine(37)-C2)-methylthiotransferase MiaB [Endomicrobiia bacterium]
MKYLIETIGCQMNVCDSDALSNALLLHGMSKATALTDADIVILNTCSVRAQAEQKAFSYLGRAEEYKEKNPKIKIVVIGCMAERLGSKIKNRFKSVDLIVGAKDIDNAAEKILKLQSEKLRVKSEDNGVNSTLHSPLSTLSHTVKYVTIMRGCDNYCSYCVVPFVRGHEISLNSSDVIAECKKSVENGAKEIILLGQNVNSYKYEDTNFSKLIKQVASIDGLENVSFMTSHPKDLSDELIDVMASEPKIKKYIHLPIQSASDKILSLMNRKYTYGHYFDLIKKLRSKIPDINITSDIIVGFPEETEDDFNETLQAVKDIHFNALFVFKYSPRPNTKAAFMKDDVSLAEKKRRHNLILEEIKKYK